MSPMDQLVALADQARAIWTGEDAGALSAGELIRVNALIGQARRGLEGAHARIASEIARLSRPEMGPEGLAKQQGFRNPTALIAATTGTTSGQAARLVKVGEATTPRTLFSGAPAPARHPHVAAALSAGTIGTDAASMIITLLDRVAFRAGADAIDVAEKTLAQQADGLTLDQLSRVLTRAEAWLDPDGVLPREDELRGDRSLYIREERNGMVVFTARLDPEHAAPLKVAIEALVTSELRAAREAAEQGDGSDPDAPRRSVPQMQADALVRLAEHSLGCAEKDLPLGGVTVVVRMNLEDLIDDTGRNTGFATIDGIAAPVSVATARRMAADGKIIPCVLGGDSEILDWGRARRLFTTSQRLALAERDGGCAMCGAPPGHVKVHHIRWWARDAGPTDLDNGVLLCESCHHRIHDNGWEIRIEGSGIHARVWFIPPPHVDPTRTPRLGARARFDFAA